MSNLQRHCATWLAAAGVSTLVSFTAMPAQSQSLGIFPPGPSAPMANAMTEQQARASCRREMRGTRESRRAIAIKMRNCINRRINGN
jgi:hypothetical protein